MLPTVFAACGWVGGFVCLILGALFAGFNVTKLYDGISLCPKSKGHVYTYEDLGKACYGRIGNHQHILCLYYHVMVRSFHHCFNCSYHNVWYLCITTGALGRDTAKVGPFCRAERLGRYMGCDFRPVHLP